MAGRLRAWTSGRPGAVAAAGALGARWLLQAAMADAPFAPFSAGEWVVRRAPGGLATRAIDLLGHQALHRLAAITIVAALGLGWLLGRRPPVVFASLAFMATLPAAFIDPRRPASPLLRPRPSWRWHVDAGPARARAVAVRVAPVAAAPVPAAGPGLAHRPRHRRHGRRAGRRPAPTPSLRRQRLPAHRDHRALKVRSRRGARTGTADRRSASVRPRVCA